MNEPERSVVEVGGIIVVDTGDKLRITQVDIGKYGILWHALKEPEDDGEVYSAYAPPELPAPDARVEDWYGWAMYGSTALPSGALIGDVCLWNSDDRDTVEEYDAEWERTIKAMKGSPEPMQSKPLPVGENVTRMG